MSPRTPQTDFPSSIATLYSAVIAGNEQGLVQERLLLAAIIEEAQEAIFSKTLDGIVTTWNHAAERLFGYRNEEIVGIANSMLVPPDHLLEEVMLVDHLCRGHVPAPFPTVRRHRDGSSLRVTLTLSPVKNAVGDVVGVSTIARKTPEPPACSGAGPYSLVMEHLEHVKTDSFSSACEALQQSLDVTHDAIVECWSQIPNTRGKETQEHNERVTTLMVNLAQHVGMHAEEIKFAKWGAQLHDIGKLTVPDEILHKCEPLTVEEWVTIRRHPAIAYDMLAPIDFLGPAVEIPYCHHERWDGAGYPRGLKGPAIPFAARLFAVIDVYDALCSDRTYRPGWPQSRVREYLRQQAGRQFDPQAVEAFLEMWQEED